MTIWTAPTELPDLRRVGVVAIDTETQDGGLRADRGSSWPWGDGGTSAASAVAWREGGDIRAIYIPMRHPDSANFDPEQVFRWLKEHIAAGVRFVTMNGLYDWGWLRTDGRHLDAAFRSARRGRRARGHGRREPASDTASTRSATARPARQGRRRCCTRGSRPPASPRAARRTQQQLHLAIAGALCRPVCRDRCGAHARSCTRGSIRSSLAKARATPIGWKST